MIRTFVSVPVPDTPEMDSLRRELRVAGIRPSPPEQTHITLRFIGDVQESKVKRIAACVERVSQGIAPFELRVSGIGAFPNENRPSVIWLGAEPAVSGAGQYSAAAFAPGQMERVQPEQALDGYLYFTPRQDTGDAEIVIGFPLRSLWGEYFDCHVLVDLPGQGLHFALTGSAQAGDSAVAAPASVMRDEDIDALAALFEAVRSLLAFVQELAGGTQ